MRLRLGWMAAVIVIGCVITRAIVVADDKPTDEPRLTVEQARTQAKLLHDTYISTLHAMHRRYFDDSARQNKQIAVPSRVMEEIFADIQLRWKMKARWLAVNAQAMSLGHEPQDDFEKEAARLFVQGKESHEQVVDGVYRHAGSIALFSSCLKCHAPAPMNPDVARYAGLVISVPVKSN